MASQSSNSDSYLNSLNRSSKSCQHDKEFSQKLKSRIKSGCKH